MTTNSTTLPAPRLGSNRTLYILASVFFLPFLVGSALFMLDWRPSGFSNHGELLHPPRVLPASGLHRIDGTPLPLSELSGKWLLTLLINNSCKPDCQTALTQIRQIHLALGKEQKRVQPVLFVSPGMSHIDESHLVALASQFPDMLVAVIQPVAAPQWQNVLGNSGHSTHVVDPFGNVMMRHDEQVTQRSVLKDVERLLKYSWVR